jgi:hypothetical protein
VTYEQADTVRAGIDIYTNHLLALGIEREGGSYVVRAFDLEQQTNIVIHTVEEAAQLFAKEEVRNTPA